MNRLHDSKIKKKTVIYKLYIHELDKACFAHDAAYYSDGKDLAKRTISEKILKDRAYEIDRKLKYDGYQKGLVSMVYKFFDKKTGSGSNVNEMLAQELHKPVIKKFKRRKVYARFKDTIWAADLADMGSLSSFNRGVKYLLCVIHVFTKYACIKLKLFFMVLLK